MTLGRLWKCYLTALHTTSNQIGRKKGQLSISFYINDIGPLACDPYWFVFFSHLPRVKESKWELFILIRLRQLEQGTVVVVIVWKLNLQLPMQAMPITTKIVSSNPAHGEVYSIQYYVIKFDSVLWQVGGFPQFPPTRKLSATI